MESTFDSMPLSTLVLGDPSETTQNSLAQRLISSGGWSQTIPQVKKLGVEVLGWRGYVWSAVVTLVGRTAKFSKTTLVWHILAKEKWSLTAKRTKKQVFVSYNLPMTDSNLSLLVENRIKEMEVHADQFEPFPPFIWTFYRNNTVERTTLPTCLDCLSLAVLSLD